MTERTLSRYTAGYQAMFDRYCTTAQGRASLEHREMGVWQHQGRPSVSATHMFQVVPTDMQDPPEGWVLVALRNPVDANKE